METQTNKHLPQVGDTLYCNSCGMELTVKTECLSEKGAPSLSCCGEPLTYN